MALGDWVREGSDRVTSRREVVLEEQFRNNNLMYFVSLLLYVIKDQLTGNNCLIWFIKLFFFFFRLK
jgi:hypothetical protein